jgi:hypothetical protein
VIIEAAGEAHAELIVVAAHPGRTALPGTVSQYVLLKARCPVTIVPGESTDEKTPLVGVAGGIMGAALGAAGNLGIKGDFKQRVQEALEPGTSAILVILRLATYDKFVEALRPYGGTIARTSLSHDAEQQLMKILHGVTRRHRPGSSQRLSWGAGLSDLIAPRTASRDPTRTSDVAPHRKQQSGNEANKRPGEVDR